MSPAEVAPIRRRRHVVVLGAGFAGLAAARRLGDADVDVTVVDRNNYHTFQPLLYQVATAGLDLSDVAYPARTVLRRWPNVRFRHGAVEGVDLDRRRVRLADGDELAYDDLIVATGATAGFFGVPGAAAHAHPLYTLEDARRLRNLLLTALEDVDAHPAAHDGGAISFVVVGGGATGVETAGALVELLDVSLRRDRFALDPDRSRVTLLDAADRLLTGFAPRAGAYARRILEARGVEVRLGAEVAEVEPGGIVIDSPGGRTRLRADVVVWAGGVTVDGAPTSAAGLTPGKGGRVVVGPDLAVEGRPEVSVVGDAAAVPTGRRARDGSAPVCPQLAQVAIQSGDHAARQVLRRMAGAPPTPFRYRDKGQMATVGRRAAVAQLRYGPVVGGTIGWLAWLGLHLVYLIGFRNRIMVLLNWTWRYLDWPSGPRLIVAGGGLDPSPAASAAPPGAAPRPQRREIPSRPPVGSHGAGGTVER